MRKFTADTVSDQKRLVRGEHWLLTRTLLRGRDHVHHKPWRILTLAGGSPQGEVTAIRELMPKAYIVAVDRDEACLAAAIDAGVNDVVCVDLANFTKDRPSFMRGNRSTFPPREITRLGMFDAVNLDFCGGVTPEMRDIINIYSGLITPRGVLLVTFSYGRDVAEMFVDALWNWKRLAERGNENRSRYGSNNPYTTYSNALYWLSTVDVSESVIGRLAYLLTPGRVSDMVSLMLYRGAQMPMCALAIQNASHVDALSFVKVDSGDFESAVVYPDAAKLYDCPQERIQSFRRRFAALKAVATRTSQAAELAEQREYSEMPLLPQL